MDIFGDQEWSYENSEQTGLPRPYAFPPLKDQFEQQGKRNLAPRVPIPWQTAPNYQINNRIGKFVELISEREKRIYVEEICGYCAVKFEAEDDAVIWINYDQFIDIDGPRIYSDYHPFHIDCMAQTRLFCPHMKKTTNLEYKYGKYQELKGEVIDFLKANGYNNYYDMGG